MASLAQYAATLHETAEDVARTRAGAASPSMATRLTGAAIYAAVFALVVAAAIFQAG